MEPEVSTLPTTLLNLLSNTLILYQTAPYLPVSSLLALGATSKSFRALVHHTHGVFRHLDLTEIKSAQFQIAAIDHGGEVWRNVQLDENVTEDEFVPLFLRPLSINNLPASTAAPCWGYSTSFVGNLYCKMYRHWSSTACL